MNTLDEQRAEFEVWARSKGWSVGSPWESDWDFLRGARAAWQEVMRRAADDRETVVLIEELRAGNGRLGIFTDCRDAKSLVVVWAQGGDPELRFYSNSLLDCLRKAVAAKRGL